MKIVFKAAARAIKPPDRRPPWKWNEEFRRVDPTSPYYAGPSTKWRSDNAPWVREPMEVFADAKVNEISAMTSAQSAKTDFIIGCFFYAVSEDPGPMQWVMKAKDEASYFVRTRLGPSIMDCDKVFALLGNDPDAIMAGEINFPGAPLLITGANSKSKLQSNPKRYLFLDEVRNYPPGAYEMVRKRVRTYWNSKTVVISTPGKVNDHVHRAYLRGDQRHYHVPCPHCAQLQKLDFNRLKAEHPVTKKCVSWSDVPGAKIGKRWNIDALEPHIALECVACGVGIKDTPFHRRMMAANGRWIAENPNAAKNNVSFHWNALLPPWVTWRSIVEEFLNAQHALRLGDIEAYYTFWTETLGLPWEDRLGEVSDYGFLDARRRGYTLGTWDDQKNVVFDWAEELVAERSLAIDKQHDHWRYVCRAVGPGGETRLVAFGRIESEAEIEALPMRVNVLPRNVMVDSGHKAKGEHGVYRLCARNKWKAFKGVGNDGFPTVEEETEKKIKAIYALTHVDPAIGTKEQGKLKTVKLFLWSNDRVKDMLAEWMNGLGPDWTLPSDESAAMTDYLDQVTAEKRVEKTDAKGVSCFEWHQMRKDNHYWDCELMILVSLVIRKLVGAVSVAEEKAPVEEMEEMAKAA